MCKWRPCTQKSSSIHEWSAQVKITRFELKAQSHNLACWSYLCQKKEKTNEEIFTKNKKTTSHWNWSMLLVYSFQTHTHTHQTPAHVEQNYILHFSVVSSILGIFSRLARFSCVWRAAQKCLLRSIIVAQAGYFRFTWPNSDSFFSFFLRVLWIKCAGMHLFQNTLHAHTTAHSIEFQFWCRIFRFIFVVVALGV